MQPIISVQSLSKSYASGFRALNDINLDIRRGEIFALLGPNGAGKTTTLRTITGLLEASEGRITYEGQDINGMATHKLVSRGIAMSPEGRGVFATQQRKTDYERLRQNWATAAAVVPGLARLRAVRSWAGFQGVTPDALPVIGRLAGHAHAYIAAGARGGYHMGPAQGLALAEMIMGRAPPLALARFDPGRFGRA